MKSEKLYDCLGFYVFHMEPGAAGCIIAGRAAVLLMQCFPVSSKLVLSLLILEG